MNDNVDWLSHINQIIAPIDYCSLATNGNQGIWTCPVYFAFDKKLNLYFISLQRTRHMRNITQQKEVAISIYSSQKPTNGGVRGLQISAEATILPDDQIVEAHKIYFNRVYKGQSYTKKPVDNMGDDPDTWKFVKVAPREIYIFDQDVFGEERTLVPREVYT